MNVLPMAKQVQVIAALTEGCSIRATERMTDVHRDTIMRLGVKVGEGCARVHGAMMRNLQVNLIEMDEQWAFIGKKQKRVNADDSPEMGDCYLWIALDATTKAVLSYVVGKRGTAEALAIVEDLRARVVNRPQITSDGWFAYSEAIQWAFGNDVDYGQVIKEYATVAGNDAAHRYSPGSVISSEKKVVFGAPDKAKMSTSYVERFNLTTRMQMRRFTRLTSGFSKKLENHRAAISLHLAWYNLCRVHDTLRVTPAMALGVTDHIWTLGELVEAALSAPEPTPLVPPTPSPAGMSAARGKGEKRGSGPSRWHRPGLRLIRGGREGR
jgi:IS1 family transposase